MRRTRLLAASVRSPQLCDRVSDLLYGSVELGPTNARRSGVVERPQPLFLADGGDSNHLGDELCGRQSWEASELAEPLAEAILHYDEGVSAVVGDEGSSDLTPISVHVVTRFSIDPANAFCIGEEMDGQIEGFAWRPLEHRQCP